MFIYTKHPLSPLMKVTMMFRSLQRIHQFDVTGTLETRLPNIPSNFIRVDFCPCIKQNQKIRTDFFIRNLSRSIYRINDQSFSLELICSLNISSQLIANQTFLTNKIFLVDFLCAKQSARKNNEDINVIGTIFPFTVSL